jgi:hypothetical protein
MELNGKAGSENLRYFHVKYIYITDLIKCYQVLSKFCPTNSMIVDYMAKPHSGAKLILRLNQVIGSNGIVVQLELVSDNEKQKGNFFAQMNQSFTS